MLPTISSRAFHFLRHPERLPLGEVTLFADMAAEGPAIREGTIWLISSNALIREALTSGCLRVPSLEDRLSDSATARIAQSLLPVQEPSTHRRIRGSVTSAFSRRSITGFHNDLGEVVSSLFADVTGVTEIVDGICRRLPVFSLCLLLGVPREDWAYVFRCARHINEAITAEIRQLPRDSPNSLVEVYRYLDTRLDDPASLLKHPAILRAHREGTLSHAELTAVAMTLFTGGMDTVGGGIANALLAIERNPWVKTALVDDPALSESVFRECLRMYSPLPMIARQVVEPTSLGEGAVMLEPGQTVFVVFAAGNLDGAAIDGPLDFRLDRDHRHDLTYGHGAHHCLGSNVADAEGAAMLRYLATHYPDWRIDHPESVIRAAGPAFNSPSELHLLLK